MGFGGFLERDAGFPKDAIFVSERPPEVGTASVGHFEDQPCVDCGGFVKKPETIIREEPLCIFGCGGRIDLPDGPDGSIEIPADAFNAGALPGYSGLQRPEYPKACRDKVLSGRVVAEFDVSPEGFASNPRVIQSSDRCFEAAALRVISKMRFEPAYDESGRAVWRRGVRQTINYELE